MAAHAVNQAVLHEQEAEDFDSGVVWSPVSSRLLSRGERRFEASTFLTDGFGLRQGLGALASTVPLSDLAKVWQPSRLKGYQVNPGRGLPFFSAGQVFESQPRVRKWLAEGMVPAPESRYLDPAWILMSCSGEVGRVTAVYDEHLDKVITHDLLRIVPHDPVNRGWLYAYMKTPTFFAIARSAQYGHMIKHLEPEHVLCMPIAMPGDEVRRAIGQDASNALELRQSARRLQDRADAMLASLINPKGVPVNDAPTSTVRASDLWAGRRRIEGQFHRSDVLQVEQLVRSAGKTVQPLEELVESVTMSNRFKRYFGANGTPYRSASELFDVNPPVTKRIYAGLLENHEAYLLRPGHMIMARSGQTYGLLGRTLVLTRNHVGTFGSEDLIRIAPDETLARTGYLHTALNHVEYGRPRVVRYASGTSVPHLDPPDIREVPIARFDPKHEDAIADLSDEATALSAEADRLESAAVRAAESVIATLTGRHGAVALGSDDE